MVSYEWSEVIKLGKLEDRAKEKGIPNFRYSSYRAEGIHCCYVCYYCWSNLREYRCTKFNFSFGPVNETDTYKVMVDYICDNFRGTQSP